MYNEASAEQKQYLRALRTDKIRINIIRAALLVFLLALWEIAADLRWIDPFIMSQPSRIVETICSLYKSGDLMMHIGTSCYETVVGFVFGTLIGSVIAIILWWSDTCAKVLEPYLVILNALPKVALGPIFIVWVGAGTGAIIVMTLAISLIVTILEVLNGLLATDKDKIKLLVTMGASKRQILAKVVLPTNIPTIVNSLKISVGLSWVGVIMGEFLVSRSGLGYLIVYGAQVFQMDVVMSSVIILAIAATLMYQVVVIIQKKFNLERSNV